VDEHRGDGYMQAFEQTLANGMDKNVMQRAAPFALRSSLVQNSGCTPRVLTSVVLHISAKVTGLTQKLQVGPIV
jgi:hypothetical protein